MSENLDLVRSIYADWERGDFGSTEWADPEIEYVMADGPAPGRWTGLQGMREGARSWISAWDRYRIKAEEFRELDGERVLVLSRGDDRGRTSGLEVGLVEATAADVLHLSHGKVTKFVVYFDRECALTGLASRSRR